MRARDASGKEIDEIASGYIARIWQHEFDHLNGVMLTDRMGSVGKLMNRGKLKELEEKYAEEHPVKQNPRSETRNPKQLRSSKKK